MIIIHYVFFRVEDVIRDCHVTGVQTSALPIFIFLYVAKEIGSSSVCSFFIKKIIIKRDIKLKSGIEKNGKNQITAAKREPKMGLKTFPTIFDVSMVPRVALASSSLGKISTIKGKTKI